MMKFPFKFISAFVLTLLLASCGQEMTVPKPSTFLRLDVKRTGYYHYNASCGYSFDVDSLFTVHDVTDEKGQMTCHKNINFGKLNGVLYFSYIDMKEPLKKYIDYALNKVDEHKVKATAIEDTSFFYPKKKVYGTFFELKGDVASPFQFYLTDSTKRFASGVVYFNAVPNYDSIRPSLDFVKVDLLKMIETFKWGE